jgi:CRP/FNR family transcriptional regulator, cyclic AMP receptor protein
VDLHQLVELLARVELFSTLDMRVIHQIAEQSPQRVVPRGTTIFVQDEPGDRMFVLAAGAVRLVVRSPQGNVVELVRHRPPAVFGEVALLDGGPRTASAEAVERSTLLVVTREEFIRLLRLDRQMADAMLRSLGTMVRRTTRQVSDLVFLDIQGRVARQLLQLADAADADISTPRVTQGELANMVGGARQTVNLALRGLEERGYIRMVGRTIQVLDPAALRRRAGQ